MADDKITLNQAQIAGAAQLLSDIASHLKADDAVLFSQDEASAPILVKHVRTVRGGKVSSDGTIETFGGEGRIVERSTYE